MKRSESLSLLSAWRIAGEPRNLRSFRAGSLRLEEASAESAREHGTAAVRAVRESIAPTCDAECRAGHSMSCDLRRSFAYRRELNAIGESRLAVRAALRAVGLKTL